MKAETSISFTPDGVTAYARVYYQRIFGHAIDDELATLIKEAAKDIVRNSPELQEEIRVKALEYINKTFGVGSKSL